MLRRMNKVLAALFAISLLAGAVRAEEDDDDPKARHATPAAKKPQPAAPAAKPADAPKPKAAATEPAPAAKKPAPVAAAEPAPAPAKKAAAAVTPVAHTDEPAPAPPTKKPRPIDPPPFTGKLPPPPAEPKATALPPLPAAPDTSAGRAVRVRLVDGSTVVGQVRAEEAGALVIDCALGQLSIPRPRISTIAYDAAAGVGSKRAPVQQLDDGDLPKKRAPQP
jgi:hypothetical protein